MVNRVLIGDFGGGDYRIRMSKPGFDVTAALEPERLAFDSTWKDSAIVYAIGSVNVPNTSAYTEVNFGETLPFVPLVYYWQYLSSTELIIGDVTTTNTAYVTYYASVTQNYIRFYTPGSIGYTAGYLVLRSMADG
ncbi:hypothetical protein SAMN04515648_4562 [Phyllobacterium sp. CL33Tsu]|uniref:hypothetical protein n=1 Tax=Phyllobacterium sp. CL33Tsu TaxID=1798191 RepID=UPI0008E2D0F5|nr:hypothetical protein [Phyllobacterium sp. CL33Tsu]SFJ55157.1 hypothetical protein SAMN04515648_4562 [Phyllobacterium sp. CL33Tsu]